MAKPLLATPVADFVDFLGEVVAQCRPRQADPHHPRQSVGAQDASLSGIFWKRIRECGCISRRLTPRGSIRWRLWFAKIERDVIARGVFTSVPDLARKLRRYINAYSANAQPIRWKYSDVTRRIRSNDLAATGH